MMLQIEKITTAKDLPEIWDSLTVEYFQRRSFLVYTENYNPCGQRYYLLKENNDFKAGLIVYNLRLDLLTYLPASLKINMRISGIPCSVSSSGFVGENEYFPEIISRLKKRERGLQLFLNLDVKPHFPGLATGRTLPNIVFQNSFSGFEDYLQALRSSYRRRYNKIIQHFEGISIRTGPCSDFSSTMYDQYIEVLKRSEGKLETLNQDFFRNLPSDFVLTYYVAPEGLIGWHISLKDKNSFYYFLGGINYELNGKYLTYFNILFTILKQGIESGASVIDFGQTAEIPKMRLGGTVSENYMMANHSNVILRKGLMAVKPLLEYSIKYPPTNVIKKIR